MRTLTSSTTAFIYIYIFLEIVTKSFSFISHTNAISRRGWFPDNTLLSAKSGTKKKRPKDKIIAINRQARRNYEILETLEAGISLKGTEVKSIRDGKMNLGDGFVKTSKDGRTLTLMNVHIGKHTMSGAFFQHEERRPRTLLVHKDQARKWKQKTEQASMTIVPLKAYFSDSNRVKIEIAVCRGKNVRDKREDIKQRDAKREDNRIIKNFRL